MTSLFRKTSTSGRIGATAALLLPAVLLMQADTAAAQIPDPPTIYHTYDPEGADPRDEWLPGTIPGTPADPGGDPDSGYYDSGFDSGVSDVGGWITVVGDLNADDGNDTFYDNLLEGGRHMLAARGSNMFVDGIIDACDAIFNFGCTVEVTNTTITDQALAGVDLLLFNQVGDNFDVPLSYTAAEATAINTFLLNGGNVLLVAESSFIEIPESQIQNYNDFLTAIGSTIQYTGDRRADSHMVISGAPFSEGIDPFTAAVYNTLTGGTPIVVINNDGDPGAAFVATQQVGGVPASAFECVLNGTSYEELNLWIYGGSTPSLGTETLCARDENGNPGGSGEEICGAAITLQLEGIGRFRKFIPDPGMDTLVLGSTCTPNGGAACILPTEPPVKQLNLNWRRGDADPQPFRRRIGSLIVDSTGLDPASNYTLINGFGNIATANLEMQGITSAEEPQTLADSRMCPEPGQVAQLLSGLFGLAGLSRLRRRH